MSNDQLRKQKWEYYEILGMMQGNWNWNPVTKWLPRDIKYGSKWPSKECPHTFDIKSQRTAFLCGEDAGFSVIDIDDKDDTVDIFNNLLKHINYEPTIIQDSTNGRGYHLFFDYNPEIKTGQDKITAYIFGEKRDLNIDVRNDHGIIFAEPSKHVCTHKCKPCRKTRERYQFREGYEFDRNMLDEVPPELEVLLTGECVLVIDEDGINIVDKPKKQKTRKKIKPKLEQEQEQEPEKDDKLSLLKLGCKYIPPVKHDSYETWLKIGLICFNEDLGIDAWVDISRRYCSDFDENEHYTKWDTFADDRGEDEAKITLGSLVHWAKDNDEFVHKLDKLREKTREQEKKKKEQEQEKIEEEKEKEQEKQEITNREAFEDRRNGESIDDLYTVKCAKTTQDEYLNLLLRRIRIISKTGQAICKVLDDRGAIDYVVYNLKKIPITTRYVCHIMKENCKGKKQPKKIKFTDIITTDTVAACRYKGTVFYNNNPMYFNYWNGWYAETPSDETSNLDAVLTHLRGIICNNNEDMYQYMLNWFAYLLQNPGKKVKTAICVQGHEGTGKSIFFEWFGSHVIGMKHSLLNASAANLVSKFNIMFENKTYVIVNEIAEKGSAYKYSDKFKTLITDGTQVFERKFEDSREKRDYTNLVLITNNRLPVKITMGDRRYACVKTSSDKVKDFNYFGKLDRALNHATAHEFWKLLIKRDVTNWFSGNIPDTVTRRQMQYACAPNHVKFLYEIHDGNYDSTAVETWQNHDIVEYHAIYEDYLHWCASNRLNFTLDKLSFRNVMTDEFKVGFKKHRITDKQEIKPPNADPFFNTTSRTVSGWKTPIKNVIINIKK